MNLSSFMLFLPGLILAQSKIDSLKDLRKKDVKENAAYYYSSIGYEFLAEQQFDSALFYYYKTMQLPHSNTALLASTMDCMGVAYKQKGFSDSSIFYYKRASTLYTQIHDTMHYVIVNSNLSIVYKNVGLYEKGLESAFEAISILERRKPDRSLASCYNTVGNIYNALNDRYNALAFYNKSLKIRKQIGFNKGVGQSLTNIGEMYLQTKQYDSAIVYLLQSMAVKRQIKDINALGNTLNLLGSVYLDLNDTSRARIYLSEALQIKRKSGERTDEVSVLNNLGRLKLRQKDLKQAMVYLNQAEILVRQTSSLATLRETLELKVKLFATLQHYSLALKYEGELMKIKDSLLNKDKAESLISLQTRYETEKKEQQIYSLEQDKILQQVEIRSKQNWIASLVVTIVFGAIIALLLLIGYKSSLRNKARVETLLKELHHRVKNNLQILSSLLSLQSQYIKDEDAVLAIKSSESRVNTMALIHRKLYKDNNHRTIDLKEYISELCTYLLNTYGFEDKVQVNLTSEHILIDVDKAIPVGLIMNEWISNALKYAYGRQPSPKLIISLKLYLQNELEIKIADNGIRIASENVGDNQSFGLKMVNTLIKELNGKLEANTEDGTNYTLQIPMT